MTPTPSQTRKPTPTPAAQPCPQSQAGAFIKQPLENDTPDAIGDCRPCGPQSQCWCGFAPTTALCEADHGQTTAHATH